MEVVYIFNPSTEPEAGGQPELHAKTLGGGGFSSLGTKPSAWCTPGKHSSLRSANRLFFKTVVMLLCTPGYHEIMKPRLLTLQGYTPLQPTIRSISSKP